jgi:hypothetical protein
MKKVIVVDSVMGSGKTQWAIQVMNSQPNRRFVYATPFKKEVDRIMKDCPGFVTGREKSKFKDFKKHLKAGNRIAITHECLLMADDETVQLINLQGYTLILDEVTKVISWVEITKKDIETILDRYATLDADNRLVWHDTAYRGEFDKVKKLAESKGLIALKNPDGTVNSLYCLLRDDIFTSFEEVYVLTYLFDSQVQRSYFDLKKIPYQKRQVKVSCSRYELVEFGSIEEDRGSFKIHICHDGKLNAIGDGNGSLSYSWYGNKARKNNKEKLRTLKKNLYNYFHNIRKAKASEILWTTFKDAKDKLKGDGFASCFESCNIRATNEFAARTNVGYCVNRYIRPQIVNFFKHHGIGVDEDGYALSEMVQFLWRTAIRNGGEIHLYIPSKRMRGLLEKWLGKHKECDAA